MTIETIYIPTVNRSNKQITYNNLPDELKKITTMVVQYWEKDKYNYDCNYFVLPDDEKYHYTNRFALANTRKLIYELGQNKKYAMFDDDITFYVRNSSVFGLPSDRNKTKEKSNHQDILNMFNLFDNWLDEPEVTLCGCSSGSYPLFKTLFKNNTGIYTAFFINGPDFKKDLSKFELTKAATSEDIVFILSLLSYGYGNRSSNRYLVVFNETMPSNFWGTKYHLEKDIIEDQQNIRNIFPENYKMKNEKTKNGGYKTIISWKKCFKSKVKKIITLDNF